MAMKMKKKLKRKGQVFFECNTLYKVILAFLVVKSKEMKDGGIHWFLIKQTTET